MPSINNSESGANNRGCGCNQLTPEQIASAKRWRKFKAARPAIGSIALLLGGLAAIVLAATAGLYMNNLPQSSFVGVFLTLTITGLAATVGGLAAVIHTAPKAYKEIKDINNLYV